MEELAPLKDYYQEEIVKGMKTLSQIIYEGIKKAILAGSIPVGNHVNEKRYADFLNISRTPIREALKRLEGEDLVEYLPKQGFHVKNITLKDVDEVYQIRKAFDTIATVNAAKNMTADNYEEMEKNLMQSEQASKDGDLDELMRTFADFNDIIYTYAEMPRLRSIFEQLYEYLNRFRYFSLKDETRLRKALDDHWVIYHYMQNRDYDKLKIIINKHLTTSEVHINKSVQAYYNLPTPLEEQEIAEDATNDENLDNIDINLAEYNSYQIRQPEVLEFAQIAIKSLIYEAHLYPKPGLVDVVDNGSHRDMDIDTLMSSALSLVPYFVKVAQKGFAEQNADNLFAEIRPIGIEAEQDMFAATAGINTHKGAIFSLGIFVAATAAVLVQRGDFDLLQDNILRPLDQNLNEKQRHLLALIQEFIQEMTKGLISKDWNNLEAKEHLTHGEKVYVEYGITGVRGEAEKGYPVVFDGSLPYLIQMRETYPQTATLRTLIFLMSEVEDTNVIKRAGIEGYHWIKMRSTEIMAKNYDDAQFVEMMYEFNESCKHFNISPGGAADLVSVTLFLEKIMSVVKFK